MLKAPKLDGDKLTFDVAVIEGDLGQADGPATVFIDIINLPMARRTAQRSAWYAAAKQPLGRRLDDRRALGHPPAQQ